MIPFEVVSCRRTANVIHRFPTDDRHETGSTFHWPPALQGQFDATAVALEVDRALLRLTLPPELDTNHDRFGKLHPLLLLVGTQRHVHPVAFGHRLHLPALKPYQEACIVIPEVHHRDHGAGDGGSTYFARLYLDQSLPTICGRWPWGWNKCLAKFRRSEHGVCITRRGETLLNLATPATPSRNSAWTSLEWNRVVQWLDQPAIIGRKVVHRPRRLQFDWSAAHVTAERAVVELGASLVLGVAPQSVTSDGMGRSRCHAFRFDAPWFLHTSTAREASVARDAGRRAAA
jgi:hypothetical protein